MTARLLQRLRALAARDERGALVGHPNFRAGKKTLAVYGLYRGRPCVAVKLPRPDGQVLLGDGRFFVTPYTGKHGWVSLWVDGPVPSSLVRDLVLRSYREVATPALLAELEAREPRSRARKARARSNPRAARASKGSGRTTRAQGGRTRPRGAMTFRVCLASRAPRAHGYTRREAAQPPVQEHHA
jgi:predicted DNA-binding protein (MmcQ/YjbR family)